MTSRTARPRRTAGTRAGSELEAPAAAPVPTATTAPAATTVHTATTAPTVTPAAAPTPAEATRLLHELQVHQAELHAQNEELARLRDELAASLAGYTDLYENAPVAYLTLDAEGRVAQFNRLATEVLGARAEALLGAPLVSFFAVEERAALLERLERSGEDAELELDPAAHSQPKIVRIECRTDGATQMRRVVMIDVTYRRLLEQAVLDAGHREQLKLGADLHDGLGQELAGIRFRLASILRTQRAQGLAESPDLVACETAVAHAMSSCRALARGLSPLAAYQGGLAEALRELAERMTDAHAPQLKVDIDTEHAIALPASSRDHLFRIAQEALNNARRHSGARHVRLSLRVTPEYVTLEIVDDGRGVAPDRPRGGLGLGLMQHRANLMNAQLTVTSEAGKGTRVVCVCAQPGAHAPDPDAPPPRPRSRAGRAGR